MWLNWKRMCKFVFTNYLETSFFAMENFLSFCLAIILILYINISYACDMRQITTADGLSNSAILSLYCDTNGFLWVGTCDGVNLYDGNMVYPARSIPEYAGISGNIIENITESAPGVLWVQTNYGFNKIVPRKGGMELFPQFQGKEKMRVTPSGTVFVLDESSRLKYYREGGKFAYLTKLPYKFSDIKTFEASDEAIRVYTATGIYDYPLNDGGNGKITAGRPVVVSQTPLSYAFKDDNIVMAIDGAGNLLQYTSGSNRPAIIHNIGGEIARRGQVSDVITDNDGNIFISFSTDGLLKLNRRHDKTYTPEDVGINVGVLCLEKSEKQNLIWIGTDCHGVYTYSPGAYSIQSITFADFNNLITRPVRAIYLDGNKNLWLGTKGDGVLLVKDFNDSNGRVHGPETLFTTNNSELLDNSVYAFSKSSRPIVWIATDDGINYYSYSDNRIHRIDAGNMPLKGVHSLYETNDSTLLASTIGYGVFRARITGSREHPELSDIKRYTIDNGNFSSNYFFSQALDNYSNPIFCNRGFGAFVLENGKLMPATKLKGDYRDKSIYDVFAAIRDKDVLWLGTGHGLLKISKAGEQLFAGAENGFINNTIHAMLKDDDGILWLSTNQGLIRFDPVTEKARVYARNYGMQISEFSDGASFRTDSSLFFGGIDGIAIVRKNKVFAGNTGFNPGLSIIRLRIAGNDMPLNEYFSSDDGENHLRLNHDQNYFSVTFSAPDFLNSPSYTYYYYYYYYSLDGKEWINNGPSSTISFTRLSHGDYTLRMKYVNRETGIESPVYKLDISVAAPWYLSVYAKLFYALLLIGAGYLLLRSYMQKQKDRQAKAIEKMEQVHKEEVYEEKLRFFTNITHEFCTPLTLIFGSCERILAGSDAGDYMLKYVRLIRSNTERLNSLIQDLIDFRRIETGHKRRMIRRVNVSELCNEIYQSFSVIAEQNNVTFESDIAPDVSFDTDYKAVLRIISNLLSNAFKYTPSGGVIRLGLKVNDRSLAISVYNTGKGLSEADKEKIFNRYCILDNVEENATKGLSSRNGLGMAICSSLVEMLDGKIEIASEQGKYAEFTVTLPELKVSQENQSGNTEVEKTEVDCKLLGISGEAEEESASEIEQRSDDKNRKSILVIDDNEDILTLLCDSLSEYNVIKASDAERGLEYLKNNSIDLIITDVMMPGTDGATLTKLIKGNKHTMYIPLVILSAKNTSAEKVEGLASGADAYIGKPFHLSYLRAVIVRLLETRDQMKEYYNSSASAFEYTRGQLVDKESKEFIDKIVEFIDSNIDDTELSTEHIAKHMQVSVRNLYRRFKDLELPSPNDFIKTHRITFAAKLLVTTSLTVQEIIYRCGFNNRSHFYREFDKQFGMTPKDYRNANKTKTDLSQPSA